MDDKYTDIMKKTTKGLWLMQYKNHGYITNAGSFRRFFYRLFGASFTKVEDIYTKLGEDLENVDYIDDN